MDKLLLSLKRWSEIIWQRSHLSSIGPKVDFQGRVTQVFRERCALRHLTLVVHLTKLIILNSVVFDRLQDQGPGDWDHAYVVATAT